MANLNQALGTDLAALAKLLRSKGRGKDSVLAHITPQEAALLKRRGGRGSINPYTGLPEFDDEAPSPDVVPVEQAPVEQAPVEQATAPTQDQAPAQPAFDPFTYNTAPGEQPYQGDPSQPTPLYASSIPQPGSAFGGVGGANIDPNAPGAATLLEPAPTPTVTPDQQTKTPGDGTKPKSLSDILSDPSNLLKGAGALGLGAFGASQARRAAGQVNAATAQQQAIAAPYQQQGQQLVAQAQAGQLSPASQQALQAAKAQINQQVANRGGVGTQQAANQVAAIYQTLLNNQYTYGLNVAQIGDNIAIGAIKQGLQLDQTLNTATTNFYSQLAQMVGSGFAPQTVRVSNNGY